MNNNFLDSLLNPLKLKKVKSSKDSTKSLIEDSQNTTQKGREAEDYACEFLIEQGFMVLERNFHTRFGELDIVAKKDGILHFVEVKSGVGFEPVYNLSPAKLEKLTKTLNIYLDKHCILDSYCLSALILFKQSTEDIFQVRWLENLTLF